MTLDRRDPTGFRAGDLLITGGPYTGKTQELMAHLQSLMAAGVPPARMIWISGNDQQPHEDGFGDVLSFTGPPPQTVPRCATRHPCPGYPGHFRSAPGYGRIRTLLRVVPPAGLATIRRRRAVHAAPPASLSQGDFPTSICGTWR